MLSNPTYAGAYVYGQRGHGWEGAPGLGAPGPRRRYALDQVDVLLRDHHPAYVAWERHLAVRAALRDNSTQFRASRGAPRRGGGLLQGLVVCGRCGCRMQLHYGTSSAAYICRTRHQRYGEPICQSLTIEHVDRAVTAAFLQVVGPAPVEAALAMAEEVDRDRAVVERQWALRLERARYDAERAFRQYDLCEPENRLVARELEGRWNQQLRLLAELEAEYRRAQERAFSPLTDDEKAALARLVGDVPALWAAPETTMADRKRLVRCLLGEVVLVRDDRPRAAGGLTTLRIGWRGGAWSELRVRRPSSGETGGTPAPVLARIRGLAQQHPDDRVAAILNAEGWRTRKALPWTFGRVGDVRRRHGIPTACPIVPTEAPRRGELPASGPSRRCARRPTSGQSQVKTTLIQPSLPPAIMRYVSWARSGGTSWLTSESTSRRPSAISR